MKFSVVTSVYNGEQYIEKALSSVNDQTERDFEYVLVDNGSFDNTSSIINAYKTNNPDLNLRIVRLEKNAGISGGRNAGISAAQGDYVCFLDADDYWYPQKLSRVKAVLDAHTDIDVVCHWEDHISEDNKTVGKYRSVDNTNAYEDLLFNGNCLSTSAMCIRRTLLNQINGFNTSLVSGEEDFDCWLRLAKSGAVFHTINEVLGVWLIRNDSVSAKLKAHTEAVVKVLDTHFTDYSLECNNKNRIEKKRNRIISRIYGGCGRTISLNGDRNEGNAVYKKALGINPFNVRVYVGYVLNILKR